MRIRLYTCKQHVTRNNTFFSKKEKLERKEYVYIYLSETISILPKKTYIYVSTCMISIIDVVDTDMVPKVNRKKKRPAKLINAIVHPPYFRERETYIFFL